jgi:hypothetical protein
MNPPTLPLDVYVRVSRVGGRGERLISPDEQEQRARALAAERGLKVGTVLTVTSPAASSAAPASTRRYSASSAASPAA